MDEIFKVPRDIERAKSLLKTAKIRYEEIEKIRTKVCSERLVEMYYDVIKEQIIALMYVDGAKTLSHIELLNYFKKNYSKLINESEFQVTDALRKKRNDISYYGKEVSSSFLFQNENIIKCIAERNFKFIEELIEKQNNGD